MADIITLSSEDEEVISPPPKKRIKPIPVLQNLLHNVTITKIPNKKKKQDVKKKQEIVVLCSDDEDDNKNLKTVDMEEKFSCIDKNLTPDNISILKINGVSIEPIIKIKNKPIKSKTTNGVAVQNDTVQIIIDDDYDDNNHTNILKQLDTSCDINEGSENKRSSKENRLPKKEESSTNENILTKVAVSDIIKPETSDVQNLPNELQNTELLEKLLKGVGEKTNEEKYKIVKAKFPLTLNYYKKCKGKLADSISFKNLLMTNIQRSEQSPALAVISFDEVFQYLKEAANADCIYVEKDHVGKIKKLEKTIRKLLKVVGQLEDEEIDFDQEDNSSYLKLERYISRLDKVFKKYCQLLKKNPYAGRLTYSKLDFVDSEYNEINRAINKIYKNNNKFPSYFEMEKIITQVVKENKLDLSESKIKLESVHCFKKLGELLQNRRRKELYESHHKLLKDTDDPAKDDSDLNTILQNSYKEGQAKLEKIVAEFVVKEETKKEDTTEDNEEDSDQSNYVDSEDADDKHE